MIRQHLHVSRLRNVPLHCHHGQAAAREAVGRQGVRGRGVLVPDVEHGVVAGAEDFARRDGEAARCTLYFGPGDIRTAEFLIGKKVDPQSGEPLEAEQRIARHQLRQVLDYAESGECRRAVQLRYFGEAHQGACGA